MLIIRGGKGQGRPGLVTFFLSAVLQFPALASGGFRRGHCASDLEWRACESGGWRVRLVVAWLLVSAETDATCLSSARRGEGKSKRHMRLFCFANTAVMGVEGK